MANKTFTHRQKMRHTRSDRRCSTPPEPQIGGRILGKKASRCAPRFAAFALTFRNKRSYEDEMKTLTYPPRMRPQHLNLLPPAHAPRGIILSPDTPVAHASSLVQSIVPAWKAVTP